MSSSAWTRQWYSTLGQVTTNLIICGGKGGKEATRQETILMTNSPYAGPLNQHSRKLKDATTVQAPSLHLTKTLVLRKRGLALHDDLKKVAHKWCSSWVHSPYTRDFRTKDFILKLTIEFLCCHSSPCVSCYLDTFMITLASTPVRKHS